MRSSRPKVLHRLAGCPLVEHVPAWRPTRWPPRRRRSSSAISRRSSSARSTRPATLSVSCARNSSSEQRMPSCRPSRYWPGRSGTLVVLMGDAPLVSSRTTQALAETHERTGAVATVLTATIERPYGYGRIVRRGGRVAEVVEEADADVRAARAARSQQRHLCLRPGAALRGPAGGAGGRTEARALPAGHPAALPRAGTDGRNGKSGRRRDPRHQQPARAGGSRLPDASPQERGNDGGGRDHRRPGDRLCRRGRGGRTRYRDSSGRHARGAHVHRRALRAARGRPDRETPSSADDVTVNNHSVIIDAEIAAAGPASVLSPTSAPAPPWASRPRWATSSRSRRRR